MFESLIALALRSLPAGLLGGYLLSGTAVRGVSPADRPSRRVLVGVLLASAVGGFVVMFVAVAALLASAPSADVAQLPSILPIMFAAGVVLTDVKRYKPCQRYVAAMDLPVGYFTPYRTDSPTRAPWLIRAVVSFGLVAFTGAAVASDPWSRADVERQIAWSTFQTIDWLQTRYIATHPQQFNELNPLLGRHPGLGSVNWIFIPTTLATPLVVDQLPSRWRPWLQWPGLVFEGAVVGRNAAIGIRLEF